MGFFNWFKKDKNKENENNSVEKNDEKITSNEQPQLNSVDDSINEIGTLAVNEKSEVEESQLNKEEDLFSEAKEVSKNETQNSEISQENTEVVSTLQNDAHSTTSINNQNEQTEVGKIEINEDNTAEELKNCAKIECYEVEKENQSRQDSFQEIAENIVDEKTQEVAEKPKKGKVGFFRKIANALKKTKDAISNKIDSIFHKELDDEFFDNLEEILIMSDLGYETSEEVIDRLRTKCKKEKLKTCDDAKNALRQVIEEMMTAYTDDSKNDEYPKVVIVVGVNGVGKTTSIGKLANYYSNLGKKVVVVAGDTFRAAASAQLNVWANRADVKIVKQDEGADSASVVFDGISFAKAKGFDVVLVDTAGRLQKKVNLRERLSKVNRVATKNWPEAHFERYIVIDATTGQNAVNQVREFDSAIALDGIVLTKLDGTAKGGIVVSICNEFEIPVKFVGVGEGIDDLVPFDAQEFVEGII